MIRIGFVFAIISMGLRLRKVSSFFVNDALVLAGIERLHVDDRDIDRAVRRKAVNFRQSVGIVDEKRIFLLYSPAKCSCVV